MARISNSTGRRPGINEGMSTDTTRFHQSSSLAEQIINSPTYQQAYELFSGLNDKSWLNELELIPHSFADPSNTAWDDIGLSNNYEDAMRQSFQDAMMQIRQLVSNYYAHVQSLPSTQVQQLADAGINAAVTGQGIDGATRSTDIPNTSTVLPSTSPVDLLVSASSFITSAVGGFADLYSKFSQVGISKGQLALSKETFNLQKSQYMTDLGKYLREHGITYQGDFNFDNLDKVKFFDPEGDQISMEKIFSVGVAHDELSPHFKNLVETKDHISKYATLAHVNDVPYYSFGGFGVSSSVAVDATTEAMYKIYKESRRYEALKNSYDLEMSDLSITSMDRDIKLKDLEKQRMEFLRNREKYLDELIEKLYKSDDKADRALLQKILSGYNFKDINSQTIDNTVGVATDIISAVKPNSSAVKPKSSAVKPKSN